MFSLFKKKQPVVSEEKSGELTFKTRVERFWEWYPTVAEQFYRMIEDKKSPELAPVVSAKIQELLPRLAWVFGPGANKQGHSFTLSGEGNIHRQLLAAYWVARAPKLPGWTFYGSRQPSTKVAGIALGIGEHQFEAKALWLTPAIDKERECIHLTIWHPLFPVLDDRTRWMVIFLLLDEALGEIGTQNWIGKIEVNDTKLDGAIPLGELRSFAERAEAENGWKKGGPGENWAIYHFKEPSADRPRGDVFLARTCVGALVEQFAKAEGELADPLKDTGADYVYVAFDMGILPKGREADARGEYEDALTDALEPAWSGRVLGGAMGQQSAYIDLLLYDGAASMKLVLERLRKQRLPAGTSVNYFAHEKRGHRIVI
jgi:hypothetical protein